MIGKSVNVPARASALPENMRKLVKTTAQDGRKGAPLPPGPANVGQTRKHRAETLPRTQRVKSELRAARRPIAVEDRSIVPRRPKDDADPMGIAKDLRGRRHITRALGRMLHTRLRRRTTREIEDTTRGAFIGRTRSGARAARPIVTTIANMVRIMGAGHTTMVAMNIMIRIMGTGHIMIVVMSMRPIMVSTLLMRATTGAERTTAMKRITRDTTAIIATGPMNTAGGVRSGVIVRPASTLEGVTNRHTRGTTATRTGRTSIAWRGMRMTVANTTDAIATRWHAAATIPTKGADMTVGDRSE